MKFFMVLSLSLLIFQGWVPKAEAFLPRFPENASRTLEVNQLKVDSDRIVGGEVAGTCELPYQVSVQRKTSSGSSHFCGGSLISESAVLCAAHCGVGQSAEKILILPGTTSLDSGGTTYTVKKILIHPDYDSHKIENDVSIFYLNEPVTLDKDKCVDVIPLTEDAPTPGTLCTVSGWGVTSEGGGSVSSQLRYVNVTAISSESCSESYGAGEITESMICAGTPEGGKDSCQGDSGGPLVTSLNGTRFQVGIVSWGYGCARPAYPGVYSNVAYLRQWILDSISSPPSKTNKIK